MPVNLQLNIEFDDKGAVTGVRALGDAVTKAMKSEAVDRQAQAFQKLIDRLEPARVAAEKLAQEQAVLNNAYARGEVDAQRHHHAMEALTKEQTNNTKATAAQSLSVMDLAKGFVAAQLTVEGARKAFDFLVGSIREAAEAERLNNALAATFQRLGMDVETAMRSTEQFSSAMRATGADDDATAQAVLRMVVVTKDLAAAQTAVQIAAGVAHQSTMSQAQAQDAIAGLMMGQMRSAIPLIKELGIVIDKTAPESVQAAQALGQLQSSYLMTTSAMSDSQAKISLVSGSWAEFRKGFGQPFIDALNVTGSSIQDVTAKAKALGEFAANSIKWILLFPAISERLGASAQRIREMWPGPVKPIVDPETNATDIALLALYNKAVQEQGKSVAMMSAHGEEAEKRRAEAAKAGASATNAGADAAKAAAQAQSQLLATYNPMHAQLLKLSQDEVVLNELVRKGGEDAYWAAEALNSLYEARRKLFTIADETMPVIKIDRPTMDYEPPPPTTAVTPADTEAALTAAQRSANYQSALSDQQAFLSQMGFDLAAGLAGMLRSWETYFAEQKQRGTVSAQTTMQTWSQTFAFVGSMMGSLAAGMNVHSKADFERQKTLQKAQVAMNTASAVMGIWAQVAMLTPYGAAALTAMVIALGAAKVAQINSQKYTPPAPAKGFETGTPYVPQTGLYQLHRGEKVIPASVSAMKWGQRDTEGLGNRQTNHFNFPNLIVTNREFINDLTEQVGDTLRRGYVRSY